MESRGILMREWVEDLWNANGRETLRAIPRRFGSRPARAYLAGLSVRFEFAEADTGGLPCGGRCDILFVGDSET